jgi:plastocyanin
MKHLLAATLAASMLVVHIKDFKYAPAPLRIHAGDRVTFVNEDTEAHTVSAQDRSFDSAGIDSGERWQHVFENTGVFRYFCQLHPYMQGTIIVLPAPAGGHK